MADIADVMDALEQIALRATFPNGTKAPGILAPRIISVGQGWPLARDIDQAATEHRTLVSIFAVPSSTSDTGQPFNTEDDIVSPPAIGITAVANEASVTLSGAPIAPEYVTVETQRGQAYTVTAQAGDTAASLAQRLAGAIRPDYPQTVVSGATVTVLPSAPRLIVRQGAPATLARRTHRQRSQFRVCVWSSNPADRAKVGRAVDTALKSENVIRLPDGSQGLVTYVGTNLDDKFEDEGIYRRDLIFNVQYDTIELYQAYVVTTVKIETAPVFAP